MSGTDGTKEDRLSMADQDVLRAALRRVVLPSRLYRFADDGLLPCASAEEAEARIRGWLLAKDPEVLLEGLSNVLYWSSQLEGEGQERIYAFRAGVRRWSLVETLRLLDWLEGPGLVSLANLNLPVFRDLFTLSALRSLSDPARHACLRPLHLSLREVPVRTLLHDLKPQNGQWPASLLNETVYERWNQCCRILSAQVDPAWRAADAERALGRLIQDGELEWVVRLLDWAESLRRL